MKRWLACEDLQLDVEQRRLLCRDAMHVVKTTACRLLALLLEHAGRIVSREQIFKHVWGFDFDPQTKRLDVQLCYLRKLLLLLDTVLNIKTHRGRGVSLQVRTSGVR